MPYSKKWCFSDLVKKKNQEKQMIYTSNFQETTEQQEILPIDAIEFPYLCNYAELDRCIDHCFPWHWHPFLEVGYVLSGEIKIRTAEDNYTVKAGEIFFINAGIMHSIYENNNRNDCKIYAHLFDMHFLSGMYNSLFERKYLLPILTSSKLQVYVIHGTSTKYMQMTENLLKIIDLNEKESFGYEFEVREKLSHFWCMLLEETVALINTKEPKKDTIDMERLKIMMQFIHERYQDKLTLEDISARASISSRECNRCFQRNIKISPMNYLNKYRVRMAAKMLLQSNDSIITISETCGFSSSSYFTKIFKGIMGCTPNRYRKR